MNNLLVTTPQTKIAAKTTRGLVPRKLTGWHIETLPSASLDEVTAVPDVTLVQLDNETRRADLKAMIPRLAHLQSGIPRGSYVLFALRRYGRSALHRPRHLQAIMEEISVGLSAFPNPERVDVVEYAPGLPAKLSLIESKLKLAPPRLSPLDQVKEVVQATDDLRAASGNLSAVAVAKAFNISLNQLASWLGRNRQALHKTPDADSLQDELAFFERVARLRAALPNVGFQKWLRMPNTQLDDKKPLDLLAHGERQVVADLVDDMLTGAPA